MFLKLDGLQASPILHKIKQMSILIKVLAFTTATLLTFGPLEGAAMSGRPDFDTQIKEKIKNIDFSDGVSKEEAIVIAQNYMIDEGDDFCKDYNLLKPTVEESSRFPENWLVGFPTTLKYRLKTGLQWNAMFVNKKTGLVKYSGEGPS